MSETLTVYFVRHGFTYSNAAGTFGGLTDVPVTLEGIHQLMDLKEKYDYPEVEKVYTSPAMRTRETAAILYPGMRPEVMASLWEMHFGTMEDQTLDKMSPEMRKKWFAGAWDVTFEGGESIRESAFRILSGMTHIVSDSVRHDLDSVAVVSHGEILYCLMKAALISDTITPEDFLLCPNGMGLVGTINKKTWFDKQVILFKSYLPEGAPRPKAEDSPFFE